MRFSHLILTLATLCLLTVRPADAEETVNGPAYIVTYFEVAPTAATQGARIARQYVEASRKEAANGEFEIFQEIERPSRFAILEAWHDKQAADAHNAGAAAGAFREKLQPLLISGFGVRPHGELSVAAAKPPVPREAIYVLTHVDVFPTFMKEKE